MAFSLISIFLAIVAISFLIFIHELGHYFMAKHVGMRVETFSIGFGRPILKWTWNNEEWKLGWLFFGGYVKIAGAEKGDEDQDPYEIKDGFWGKSPWDRIKVAITGPLVNLVFAFLVFSFLWVDGGREKNFTEFTHKIGWVDPNSALYAQGVRPGDEITSYDDRPFTRSKDHIYAPLVSGDQLHVKGNRVDYATGEKVPFDYSIQAYPHPQSIDTGILTSGVTHPASYVIYDKLSNGQENPLLEGAPLQESGIQYGDRIIWVDGEPIFSVQQLNYIINDERALLTVSRNGKQFLARVPRVKIQELHLPIDYREEMTDWQFEAGLSSTKLRNLYTLPYEVSNDLSIETTLRFIDNESAEEAFPKHPYSTLEKKLLPGDKIIAVDGQLVDQAYALLPFLQQNRVTMVVQRDPSTIKEVEWLEADSQFDKQLNLNELSVISKSIGTEHPITQSGNYILLNPIIPKMRKDFRLSPEKQAWVSANIEERRKQIESIEDPEKKTQALQMLESQERQLLVGLPNAQDRKVNYNPPPTTQFGNVFGEVKETLSALFTGNLNPKWVAGPVGIVQVVHSTSMVSWKESLFWIGAISLNLGLLNLLPIPMLDGGTILFNLFELVTRRRIPPKVLERMVIPFAVLLITFILFITYNDISRIFGGFWR